ncbi:hypothetical protein EDB85DRAFT_2272514 [Lactarius pseudohatsudake]|nr:hypothetical protein EDB85DRAFT_2272514 [Lactarius pseudohatsudake]
MSHDITVQRSTFNPHPLSARGPWPPFPTLYTTTTHDHDTTRKRGTTRDKGGGPLCPLAPAESRKGAAHAPPRAPVCAQRRRGTGTRTPPPPPPLLTRERGLCRKARPPFARAMGARQVSPPASLVHARTIRTRDKPLPPPLPFVRKGGEAHERGHATRDGMRERARTAPSPLPGLRAEPTRKRGARAGTRAGVRPTPLAPRRRLHVRGARSRLERAPSPRVGARGQRTEAAPPPLCIRHKGKRTGGSLGPRAAPPFPGSRARANANRRQHGTPPLSRGFARNGERKRAATRKRPHPPGSHARAKRHAGSPPPVWRVTGRRADREARPGAPALRFAHKGGTCMRAALVRKAERARG